MIRMRLEFSSEITEVRRHGNDTRESWKGKEKIKGLVNSKFCTQGQQPSQDEGRIEAILRSMKTGKYFAKKAARKET